MKKQFVPINEYNSNVTDVKKYYFLRLDKIEHIQIYLHFLFGLIHVMLCILLLVILFLVYIVFILTQWLK